MVRSQTEHPTEPCAHTRPGQAVDSPLYEAAGRGRREGGGQATPTSTTAAASRPYALLSTGAERTRLRTGLDVEGRFLLCD